MKKFFLFIVTLLFAFNVVKAQLPSGSYTDYMKEGMFLVGEENYDMALRNFLEAYKQDSSSSNVNFNVGFCYLNSSNNKVLAEGYLAKSLKDISKNYQIDNPNEKSAPPLAVFYYGKALHINYKFDEAQIQYDNFLNTYAKDKATKDDVAYFKAQNEFAKEIVAVPINVKIQNLGDSINSEFPDYSPVLSADESSLIYTTRRNTGTGGERLQDGQYYEDIVISYKDANGVWSTPKSVSQNINTAGHDASINLTADGQTLIAFRDDSGDGNVYFSSWDGKDWSPLQSFGSDINSKYWESHACLSADNNTLYFVSDRPGGYGGRDIYRCVKLPNGAWSKALNVGPTINTKYDEDGPYIHPDGLTLIFASSGHKSMGGFDIFFTTIEEDKKFAEPVNMGYPINTTDDDVFLVTSPDGKRGYFSSSTDGGKGAKDIYMMSIPDAKEKPLVLFKGAILTENGQKLPDDILIVVTNKETGEVVGYYRPKENGTFATILAPNKNYNFSYQINGQEFYNEDIYVSSDLAYQEIKKEINLDPVNLLASTKSKGIVLNTVVLNNAIDKQPVANAKITLTQKGGTDTDFDVDANGKKDATPLEADKLYTLVAEVNGKKSKVSSFNTVGVKGSKSITQVLYLDDSQVAVKGVDNADNADYKPNVACGSPVKFKQNFGYNVNDIDEKKDWEVLVDAIVSKTKECNPTVKIISSASQVPTRLFSSNKELAKSRASKMEDKIRAAVTAKGGDGSKISFVKIAAVRGPVYESDYKNTKKYGPFQYVRVIAR